MLLDLVLTITFSISGKCLAKKILQLNASVRKAKMSRVVCQSVVTSALG